MSKTAMILSWMKGGRFINSKIAFEQFGVTRLASIIFNLRQEGLNIDTEMKSGVDRFGNIVRYANYWLLLDDKGDVW